MTKKIIIGNWKMNPAGLAKAKEIFQKQVASAKKLKKADVVLCVPYVYTSELGKLSKAVHLTLGAQNVFYEEAGSFTGEVSTKMLKDLGLTHVILGHSERRKLGETNEDVRKKVNAVVQKGLTAVVCVGEENRDTGGKFYRYLQNEIQESLGDLDAKYLKKVIIAYEPIWAIGKTADDAMDGKQMHEMSIFIKKVLADVFGRNAEKSVRIIYGGSVDSTNIESLIREGHIDGVLPGRASLDPKEFGKMLDIADKL